MSFSNIYKSREKSINNLDFNSFYIWPILFPIIHISDIITYVMMWDQNIKLTYNKYIYKFYFQFMTSQIFLSYFKCMQEGLLCLSLSFKFLQEKIFPTPSSATISQDLGQLGG